ncbi:MAG: hypothetical protein LBJ00_15180 [Planctomycetaceae bacterium]|jgi:hypothetical protein|nr:hypothetical protein [Planctomycetaceae bacterium]
MNILKLKHTPQLNQENQYREVAVWSVFCAEADINSRILHSLSIYSSCFKIPEVAVNLQAER